MIKSVVVLWTVYGKDPVKYGIKVWMVADSNTGYVYKYLPVETT